MIAALIHIWKKNQADEASLNDQDDFSVSQATALADSEDLENDLSEPTDGALDNETDHEMETDDAVIVEDDDLADEFFEEDSGKPEKPADEEFSKAGAKRDLSAKKSVSLDSIELDLTRSRHNSLKSKKANKDSQQAVRKED